MLIPRNPRFRLNYPAFFLSRIHRVPPLSFSFVTFVTTLTLRRLRGYSPPRSCPHLPISRLKTPSVLADHGGQEGLPLSEPGTQELPFTLPLAIPLKVVTLSLPLPWFTLLVFPL